LKIGSEFIENNSTSETRHFRNLYSVLLPLGFILLLLFSCKTNKNAKDSAVPSDNYRESAEESQFKRFYIEACKHKALGNPELALDQFNKALAIFPKNSAALYEIGNIYRYQQKWTPAIQYSKSALEKGPENPWFHLLYIECLHGSENYSGAAQACEQLIKRFPNNLDYYNRLADEYINSYDYSGALKAYDDIEKLFGPSSENLLNKVKAYKALRKPAKAELILIQLIKANPSESIYYTYLAELYQENNHPEKAMEIYKQVTKIDPGNPYVHLSIADYYRRQRNDSAFFKELRVAFSSQELEMEEKSKILISLYSVSEEFPAYRQNGIELCEILVKVHPEDARSHSIYGDYLSREGKQQLAREQYCLALKYEPGVYLLWQEVMKLDVELLDYAGLEQHSKEASDLFSVQPLPFFYLGAAKVQLKKYEEAIQALMDARDLIIGDTQLLAQVYINLGDAYNSLKKFPESDKAYEEALKLDKENVYLLNNYSYYLSVRKEKLKYAEELSQKANNYEAGNPQFLDTYAWILYQQGRFDEAKTWIEKAMEKDLERNGVILEHYGDILYKLNQVDKALIYWKKSKDTGRHSEFIDKKISEKKIYE
jgi:tetratricopeptide (TPR) repeat protein